MNLKMSEVTRYGPSYDREQVWPVYLLSTMSASIPGFEHVRGRTFLLLPCGRVSREALLRLALLIESQQYDASFHVGGTRLVHAELGLLFSRKDLY